MNNTTMDKNKSNKIKSAIIEYFEYHREQEGFVATNTEIMAYLDSVLDFDYTKNISTALNTLSKGRNPLLVRVSRGNYRLKDIIDKENSTVDKIFDNSILELKSKIKSISVLNIPETELITLRKYIKVLKEFENNVEMLKSE